MYVEDTFPELHLKNDRNEEAVETTVRSGGDEPEGIPQGRASMSIMQSISKNDDHYNEYARSSSRNGRTNEWKRRNTYGGHLYSGDPKSLWKTLTSPVPLTLVGDDDKPKMSHQKIAITPVSSNDSMIGIQGEIFDVIGKVEPFAQNISHASQCENNAQDKADNLQQAFDGPQKPSAEVPQREVQECERQRNQTGKTLKETEGMSEKQGDDLSSLENNKSPSTGEKKDTLLRHSALKKIDQVSTKHAKQEKSNVRWSDKKVQPKVLGDSHKGLDRDRSKTTSMEGTPFDIY